MAEAEVSTKWCPQCKIDKKFDEFGRDKNRKFGLKGWCRSCHNSKGRAAWEVASAELKAKHKERTTAWRLQNMEKQRFYGRAYQKRNPEKTKASFLKFRRENRALALVWAKSAAAKRKGAQGSYSFADIADISRLQRGLCAYCRVKLKSRYHVDHVMPIALGGSNNRQNLQLTCPSCNARKHAKHPMDYARQLGRLL